MFITFYFRLVEMFCFYILVFTLWWCGKFKSVYHNFLYKLYELYKLVLYYCNLQTHLLQYAYCIVYTRAYNVKIYNIESNTDNL